MGSLLLLHNRQYYKRVLRTGPIAYWPQWEPSGTVAYDRTANARNGAYTGVDLGQVGIGDGRVCPWFDGTNDYNNVYSAGLAGAFSGAEGSLMVWAKVNSAAVWADGILRELAIFRVDASDKVEIYKNTTNNQVVVLRVGSNPFDAKSVAIAWSGTAWFCVGSTWSVSGDELRVYLNGVQSGATQTGLTGFVGALANTSTCVGAVSTVPTNVWHGWLAHACVWDRALTPSEVASLARVR